MYRALPLILLTLAVAMFACAPLLADDAAKGNTHAGKIVSVTGNKFVMADLDGKNRHTHTLAADAKCTCNGKDCKLADLKPGTLIRVTTKADDKTVAIRIDARKLKDE
jgi:hypothetical protein